MYNRIKNMNWGKSTILVTLVSLTSLLVVGCDQGRDSTPAISEQTIRPEDWTEETHGDNVDPDYEVVFPEDSVNQIIISIAPDDWKAMQDNMASLFGAQGAGQQGAQPKAGNADPNAGRRPGIRNVVPGAVPDAGGQAGRGGGNLTPENPMWVPATIEFNGLTWTNVGIRYKGNSSLASGWRNGSLKMPLKLDFDEYEDDFPEIDNQRFYGFKQLSLSNVFSDATYMHDTLASDILDEAGLPAAKTAYYEVIMDYGEGEVNLGLYVMIEVIDDTVIDRYFADDSGNIYEADGQGVSLAQGTYNQIKDCFLKENNTTAADWGDIEELYNILHSENRTADPTAWRKSLESIFDVDGFLEWLGIAAIIQHWDTYGAMSHNFYLYDNPDTGQLTWISWDHNQVLAGGGDIGAPNARVVPGVRAGSALTLGRDEVSANWPLIRYLLDDPVYHDRYIEYIEKTLKGAFNPHKLKDEIQKLEKLIAPYVTVDNNGTAFQSAVQQLIKRIDERYQAANAYLAEESK